MLLQGPHTMETIYIWKVLEIKIKDRILSNYLGRVGSHDIVQLLLLAIAARPLGRFCWNKVFLVAYHPQIHITNKNYGLIVFEI